MASRCNQVDCQYHGIECCMLKGDPVLKDRMCVSYVVCEPVHITATDLRAPFECKCHKGKGGKYVSDVNVKVIK